MESKAPETLPQQEKSSSELLSWCLTLVLKALPKTGKMFSNHKLLIPGKSFVSIDTVLHTANAPHLTWEVLVLLQD